MAESSGNGLGQLVKAGGHRTLAERAFASLHEAIVTGQLSPGERLPIEELARVLEISPMPVREALRRLEAAGMVENLPHRGARVTELSHHDLQEVYEARLALEPLAISRAAASFDEEAAAASREALERHNAAIAADELPETWVAHTDFHFSLYRPAGSRWLLRLITPLWESSERYRHATGPIEWRLQERQREHERLLDACIAGDPERAAGELYNHLAITANLVSEQMVGETLFELKPVPGD